MAGRASVTRTETGDGGYVYKLEHGRLTVSAPNGSPGSLGSAVIWQSDAGWWIDDFRLGDVDGDGRQDFVFSLWKSYRFGDSHPARMDNSDDTVRNHLFVDTVIGGHVKSIWASSDLPRPIYSFRLDPKGQKTVVSSGMLLRTQEGKYRNDFARTRSSGYIYRWEKWGFVEVGKD